MRYHWAVSPALSYQLAEMFRLVIEAAGSVRLIQFNHTTIDVVHRCPRRVPPVRVDDYEAARSGKDRISVAEQVDSGVKLRHSALVFGLENGKGINTC